MEEIGGENELRSSILDAVSERCPWDLPSERSGRAMLTALGNSEKTTKSDIYLWVVYTSKALNNIEWMSSFGERLLLREEPWNEPWEAPKVEKAKPENMVSWKPRDDIILRSWWLAQLDTKKG